MGTDPFSNVKTHLRPWDVDGSLETFLTRVDVAFEFFTKRLAPIFVASLEVHRCSTVTSGLSQSRVESSK